MDIDIKELIKAAAESLDLKDFKGDVVGVKVVENEIGNVEAGGIGVQKVYGKDVQNSGEVHPQPVGDNKERKEELFHFVHPELEEDEAWRVHDAIKRLVTHQKVQEICLYLKELKGKQKVLLPQSPGVAYKELVRMGMPTGDGYSEKYFSGCYQK